MPETPFYLLSKGKEAEAEKSLQWLRGKHFDISEEIHQISQTVKSRREIGRASIKDLLTVDIYWKPLFIVSIIFFVRQFCGINAVMFYLQNIFIDAGVGMDPGRVAVKLITPHNAEMQIGNF